MTRQPSQSVKNDIDAIVGSEQKGLLRKLEDPMWQAIFASVSTISLFGFVLSGIWMVNAIVN